MRNTKQWSRILLAILAAGTLVSSSVYVSASPVKVSGTGTTSQNGGQYDGNVDGGSLTNGAPEIDVQVKTTGGAEIVYDLDIDYGAMTFEYDYGSTWNPTTHSYTAGNSSSQTGGWVTTYVNGTNNKITVTNNSNFPMHAGFSFTASGTALNASSNAAGSVVGIFSDNNDTFLAPVLNGGYGSTQVGNLGTANVDLEMNTTGLVAGNTYYYKKTDDPSSATNATDDIFFALSGRPDVGGPTTLTSVGKITVTISPATGVTQVTKS